MKKILNGLRYGNIKTKAYIIGILLLFLFGTFSIGMLITTWSPLWGMSIAFSYLTAIILMQSVSFHKVGEVQKRHKEDKLNISEDNAGLTMMDLNPEEETKQVKEQEDFLEKYDQKKLKAVFVKYKVNKEHYPIIVDSSDRYQIHQCPTYAWIGKGELNLLLFEKEPRKVTVLLSNIHEITYERGVIVNSNQDYSGLQKPSFLRMIFSSYLPTVYEETIAGKRSYKKNLYVIGEDLKVTNTSAATMFKMLSMNLSVRRQIRDKEFQNPYFEAAYALNIMLKDTVITVNEFKVKIKEILQNLADAKISNDEFMNYINQLIRGRLITREYAQYYIENKNRNKIRS